MRKIPNQEIYSFLSEPRVLRLMRDASDRGRPAVEPLEDDVERRFGPLTPLRDFHSFKKRFGLQVRYVMEDHGYRLAERNVYVGGKVFSRASRYEKV